MNIFARELSLILAAHGKTLSSLYGMKTPTFQLGQNKVTRLRRSLWEDITATLNEKEMDVLQLWVPLNQTGTEMQRLRAALVAEGVRHLLGGRISAAEALRLGDLTFQLMLSQQSGQMTQLRDEILDNVRGDDDDLLALRIRETPPGKDDLEPDEIDAEEAKLEVALESAIELYEQGLLWLEVARQTADHAPRQGYLAQGRSLLRLA